MVDGDNVITYEALDNLTDCLAGYLQKYGVGYDEPVGILLETCAQYAIAISAHDRGVAVAADLGIDSDLGAEDAAAALRAVSAEDLLAASTGVGAVVYRAKVEPGSNVVVFGLGGIGLNVIQGAAMVGAGKIIGVDLNPSKVALATRFGMTDFINPSETDDVVEAILDLTGGGADYSFECIGNVNVMRQALECCHKGWGESYIIGVAGAGKEIATRPFQLVTGRSWHGVAFGGARGRTDVPTIVDWYMEGKINIDDLITHTMPLDDINTAFDLMHAGESIRSVVLY